jgi:hypothetical protein
LSATSRSDRVAPSKIDVICENYKEALQILKYLPQKNWGLFGKHYILQFQTQRIILI